MERGVDGTGRGRYGPTAPRRRRASLRVPKVTASASTSAHTEFCGHRRRDGRRTAEIVLPPPVNCVESDATAYVVFESRENGRGTCSPKPPGVGSPGAGCEPQTSAERRGRAVGRRNRAQSSLNVVGDQESRLDLAARLQTRRIAINESWRSGFGHGSGAKPRAARRPAGESNSRVRGLKS